MAPGKEERHTANTLLATAGIAAPLLYFFSILIIGIIRRDYRFDTKFISQLTVPGAPWHDVVIACIAAFNVLIILFAVRLWALVRTTGDVWRLGYAGVAVMVLQGCVGFSRVVFFHMDRPGAGTTAHGMIHMALAGVGAVLGDCEMFLLAAWFRRAALPFRMARYSLISAWGLALMFPVAAYAAFSDAAWKGLPEKLGVCFYLQWMFVLAVQLLRTT